MPGRIALAAESPFRVGVMNVTPASLQVEADGVCHPVPPRVMQVLVALASARPRTVSRDELAERCWHGRIVGEDALNRIIAKLRMLALGPGAGSFAIETVKRVGYRIVVHDETEASSSDESPAPKSVSARSLALVAALVMLLGGGLWLARAPAPPAPGVHEPRVAAATDMETRGLSAVFDDQPDRRAEGINYLRQATAMAPRQPKVWGALAMAYVLSLPDTPLADRETLVARIREVARRGLALDPREGRSIAALVSLAPSFGHWREKDDRLRDDLARATPGTAPLIFQRVLFLSAVGRSAEALDLVDGLNATTPLVPWIQAARINLLVATGHPDAADRVATWAAGVWPRNRQIWFTRFDLAAFGGRPRQALALAANGGPDQTDAAEIALAVATARAIDSRAPADADAVLAAYRRHVPLDQANVERAIRAAAALGRPDDALAFANMLYATDLAPGPRSGSVPFIGLRNRTERNTTILFMPPAAILWDHPGFAALLARIGLVAYWRGTGPPDLCTQSRAAFCAGLRPIAAAGSSPTTPGR
jgi:DNA-binding winged helix-turn-helix (wHTH) protein